jgi:hypothetical protein
MKRTFALLCVALLAACAGTPEGPPAVDRIFVIGCGENHTKDLSRWTPGVNVGKAHAFANHCYLIQHAKGLMLWDTGNPDRLAAMPNGFTTQSPRWIE